jgi:hypothetical protein
MVKPQSRVKFGSREENLHLEDDEFVKVVNRFFFHFTRLTGSPDGTSRSVKELVC